jgi:hypothetical protein
MILRGIEDLDVMKKAVQRNLEINKSAYQKDLKNGILDRLYGKYIAYVNGVAIQNDGEIIFAATRIELIQTLPKNTPPCFSVRVGFIDKENPHRPGNWISIPIHPPPLNYNT